MAARLAPLVKSLIVLLSLVASDVVFNIHSVFLSTNDKLSTASSRCSAVEPVSGDSSAAAYHFTPVYADKYNNPHTDKGKATPPSSVITHKNFCSVLCYMLCVAVLLV